MLLPRLSEVVSDKEKQLKRSVVIVSQPTPLRHLTLRLCPRPTQAQAAPTDPHYGNGSQPCGRQEEADVRDLTLRFSSDVLFREGRQFVCLYPVHTN